MSDARDILELDRNDGAAVDGLSDSKKVSYGTQID